MLNPDQVQYFFFIKMVSQAEFELKKTAQAAMLTFILELTPTPVILFFATRCPQ